MIVIGLTGSIGMGKSTAAAIFRNLGVPVFDSDACVHDLSRPGGIAVEDVLAHFPESRSKNVGSLPTIDRQKLGKIIFANSNAREQLEAILHPYVWGEQAKFKQHMRRTGQKIVMMDIPLLFETGAEKTFDHVAVVSTDAATQKSRVLAREGMTDARFQQLLAKQMPDEEKRKKADFVIPSGTLEEARQAVEEIAKRLGM